MNLKVQNGSYQRVLKWNCIGFTNPYLGTLNRTPHQFACTATQSEELFKGEALRLCILMGRTDLTIPSKASNPKPV